MANEMIFANGEFIGIITDEPIKVGDKVWCVGKDDPKSRTNIDDKRVYTITKLFGNLCTVKENTPHLSYFTWRFRKLTPKVELEEKSQNCPGNSY